MNADAGSVGNDVDDARSGGEFFGVIGVAEALELGGLEPGAEIPFHLGDAAADVALGVLEGVGDAFERPAGVFLEGQHGEVTPFAGVGLDVVPDEELPLLIEASAGEDDFVAGRSDRGHGGLAGWLFLSGTDSA